jgi:hypothetical protein
LIIGILGPLAQLVEQLTLNQLVVGSIPTRPTNPGIGASHLEDAGSRYPFPVCIDRKASGIAAIIILNSLEADG